MLKNNKYPYVSKEIIMKQMFHKKKGYYDINFAVNKKIKHFSVHQLVGMAFFKHVPCGFEIVVDHINNVKTNTNICNLQIITQRENLSKDKKNKTSKYTGVCWCKRENKWVSAIRLNGKKITLGHFNNEEEAGECYQNALKAIEKGTEIKRKPTFFSSKHMGVYLRKDSGLWRSQIMINYKKIQIGNFANEETASIYYQKAFENRHLFNGSPIEFREIIKKIIV